MHSLAACLISSRVLTNPFSTPRDMTPRVVPFFAAAWEEGFKYTIPFNQTSQCGSSCKVLGAYTTKKTADTDKICNVYFVEAVVLAPS